MKITDADKNLNSKDQFSIQLDDVWHTIEAVDFFDYLAHTGKIDGHDPESATAWVDNIQTVWNPGQDEPREINRGSSHSYQWWIEDLIDDDEVLLEYMKTIRIVTAKAA